MTIEVVGYALKPECNMSYFLGIDIGTSGTKTILIDVRGALLAQAHVEYPLLIPKPGWTEQNPEDWWLATVGSIKTVLQLSGISPKKIKGIGLSGQMHGSVFLDKNDAVIRPALLWNDQRTAAEVEQINEMAGKQKLLELTGNPALAGFTAPKILWLRNHEPDDYERVRKVLLPKDYIRFRLTGEFATEVSDASGTLLFDVANRRWSEEMLALLEIPSSWMPMCFESPEAIGRVSRKAAKATGLSESIPVVGGGGDQAAGAVGNGIVEPGIVSAVLGTSGVVFAYAEKPDDDPDGSLHTFCHAVPGAWHQMGVTLSAGGSFQWLRDTIFDRETIEARKRHAEPYQLMAGMAGKIPPGSEGLFFLPYLSGERTPHADADARGVFFGLSLIHNKKHFARAVMEGVSYSLRDCLELMKKSGINIREIRASGGGARSKLWRQMLANVFNAPVVTINMAEGPAFGAALLAAVGTGAFSSVPEACRATISVKNRLHPEAQIVRVYDENYAFYRSLYPALKERFGELDRVR
jgi:xylulokinase